MKNKKDIFITNSFQETQELARKFAEELKTGDVVALYGDLGGGKTTFAQGLAKGLGINKRIISPTFIIVRKYRIKNRESRIKDFYHIDLYRIPENTGIDNLGLDEILNDPNSIVAIEWAEKLGKGLPKKRWDIKFEYLGEDKRKITINNYGK